MRKDWPVNLGISGSDTDLVGVAARWVGMMEMDHRGGVSPYTYEFRESLPLFSFEENRPLLLGLTTGTRSALDRTPTRTVRSSKLKAHVRQMFSEY